MPSDTISEGINQKRLVEALINLEDSKMMADYEGNRQEGYPRVNKSCGNLQWLVVSVAVLFKPRFIMINEIIPPQTHSARPTNTTEAWNKRRGRRRGNPCISGNWPERFYVRPEGRKKILKECTHMYINVQYFLYKTCTWKNFSCCSLNIQVALTTLDFSCSNIFIGGKTDSPPPFSAIMWIFYHYNSEPILSQTLRASYLLTKKNPFCFVACH